MSSLLCLRYFSVQNVFVYFFASVLFTSLLMSPILYF